MRIIFAGVSLIFLFTLSSVYAGDPMKAFPLPDEGQTRYLIQLVEQEDETKFQIELIVGKTVKIDEKNQYFFGGSIETESIAGWGYSRYVLRELGPMAGTLMAVDPDAPKIDRFVRVGGEPYLVRYNSRLPVVVYVPEGVELRYRIWSADPVASVAKEG